MALDLLHYADPSTQALRAALERGALRWVCDDACAVEFERVLGYPELKLTGERGAQLSVAFKALTERVAEGPDPVPLPLCRDPDDQKFLRLAARVGAHWLLTRDKALLRLSKRVRAVLPELVVCTPQSATGHLPFD